MIKAMIVPMVLIIIFGGGFVAFNKPFKPLAVAMLGGLVVSILIFGYAKGLPRVFGAVGLVACLFGLYAVRGKR